VSNLEEASTWVGEHGGCAACARSVLVETKGRSDPRDIRDALQRMEAPPEVFALVWQDVWAQTRSLGGK